MSSQDDPFAQTRTDESPTSSEIARTSAFDTLQQSIDAPEFPTQLTSFAPRSQQVDRSSVYASAAVPSDLQQRRVIRHPTVRGEPPQGFRFTPHASPSTQIASSDPGALSPQQQQFAPVFSREQQQLFQDPSFQQQQQFLQQQQQLQPFDPTRVAFAEPFLPEQFTDEPEFASDADTQERIRFQQQAQQQQQFDPSTFEEEKEQEDPVPARAPAPSITEFAEELGRRGVTEFSTAEFNSQLLGQLLDQQVDFTGTIATPRAFADQLGQLLEIGLRQALSSGDPGLGVERVFSTVGNTLEAFERNVEDTEAVSKFVNRAIFSTISKSGIEDIKRVPVDDAALIGQVFQDDTDQITSQTNLPLNDIQMISRMFAGELRDLTRQQLLNLNKWVNDHVADQRLKATLASQVNSALVIKRRSKELEIPLLAERAITQTLQPISQSQGILVPSQIQDIIRDSVAANIFRIADLQPDDRLGEVQALAEHFNAAVNSLKFTQTINGVRSVPHVKTRSATGRDLSGDEILGALASITERLDQPEVIFTYFPTRAEGRPLDMNQIAQQIMRDFQPRTLARKRTEKQNISQPRSVFKIGNVTIKERTIEGRKEREIDILPNASVEDLLKVAQALIMENGTLKDVKRNTLLEIVKGETTIEEVLRVFMNEQKINLGKIIRITYNPASLVGGAFLDGFMSPLLSKPFNLRKGMSTNVMRTGITFHNPKGGILPVPFRKLYRPADVGLEKPLRGGALPFQIQITPESMRRLEMNQQQGQIRGEQEDRRLPVGGDIFSSIFGAVGNVVKTVASVPLQVAGAVFGGDLPKAQVKPLLQPRIGTTRPATGFVSNNPMIPAGTLIRVES